MIVFVNFILANQLNLTTWVCTWLNVLFSLSLTQLTVYSIILHILIYCVLGFENNILVFLM